MALAWGPSKQPSTCIRGNILNVAYAVFRSKNSVIIENVRNNET